MNVRILLPVAALGLLAACGSDPAETSSNPIPTGSSKAAGPGQGGAGDGGAGDGGAPSSTSTSTSTSTSSADGGAGPGPGGSTSSLSSTSGSGGQGACNGGDAFIQSLGAPDRILLRGTIVTPAGPIEGELLVVGNSIACVAQSCAGHAQSDGATIVDTQGFVLPGLQDTHNHILFSVFDGDDWTAPVAYNNHNQWPNNEAYKRVVDAKQYLNGEMGSPVSLGCEVLKYGEMKALIAGTTSVQGSPGTGRLCYQSMVRSIDTQNRLGFDRMQTATIFPTPSAADGVCRNFSSGNTTSYLIHIGEGVDETSRNEFDRLRTIPNEEPDDCLIVENTTIIHGTALTNVERQIMADNGMSMSWSPKSNIFLYGLGSDLSKTNDIPAALGMGINVAISPDWSLGGSVNMLDELRYADFVDNQRFGDILDARTLFEMATINAAKAMHLEDFIGSLEVGKRADLFVLRRIESDPYESLLLAIPRDVVMTMVDGQALYGDTELEALAPPTNRCEALEICCAQKFACIAETVGNPEHRLNQTFAEIEQIISDALTDYDSSGVSPDQYMPLAPIVRCPGD